MGPGGVHVEGVGNVEGRTSEPNKPLDEGEPFQTLPYVTTIKGPRNSNRYINIQQAKPSKATRQNVPLSQWLPPLSFLSVLGLIAASWYSNTLQSLPPELDLVGAAQVEAIHYQFDQLMDHPHRRNLGPRVICLSSCPWRVSLPVISTSPIAAVGLRLPVASTPEGSRSWSTLPHSATRLRHSNLLLLPIAWFCIRNGGYCMSLPSSVALFTVAASSSLRANADGSHEGRIQYYAVNQWLPIFIVRTILCWTGRSTRVCFACFLHRHF
jgi:hypothetical protein